MAVDQHIVNAWLTAANDLGIRVIAPYRIKTSDAEFWFEAHIVDFGGPNGTVAGNAEMSIPEIRRRHGYFSSDLGPSYRQYGRRHFIDTLNDWGWFGEADKRPAWYTGKPWS